jgi:predicted regulator of Ras-like GTPase activity (Roadblock/LC7/MglB family)
MQEILDKLNRVRGVGGCLVISNEGLPMITALRQGTDESEISATLGTLLGSAQHLGDQLKLGKAKAMQAIASAGGLLLLPAGPAYLAILMDPTANLALLQLEARPFAERLAQRLSL